MVRNEIIPIRNSIDIVAARMVVRDTARQYGLRLMDQSCISLATSAVAVAMGMGLGHANDDGEIFIECLQNGNRKGLRVTCTREVATSHVEHTLTQSRSMVDEFEVKSDPPKLSVVMTKWSAA